MITIDGLSFGYQRSEPILSGLSYEFGSGLVSGVTGLVRVGEIDPVVPVGVVADPLGRHPES